MSHTSRLVAAEIQNANQLLNGVIEAVITTTPDDSMPGFGLQVRRGKQLFNVWVDCDPEGNGPGHLNVVREHSFMVQTILKTLRLAVHCTR